MKHTAVVRLFQPGIVLFDPQVLDAFLATHLPGEAHPLEAFIARPALGDAAVRAGAVVGLTMQPSHTLHRQRP
ncbi:MAG: hypothetical protein RR704_24615 [Stenotrophomonas sp.]|uniref:hypothetical protein n=1 Tax=Stenotrophomonas sp. TaxID=69392 RepID=UPI002FCB1C6C